MTTETILAGFGGQGILFAGKLLAYLGMNQDKNVSWLPSYGPEMRGGTANCSVCVGDEPIGSPYVTDPDVLIAMNGPSYDKFIDSVKPGGIAIIDSTLVTKECRRKDIRSFCIPVHRTGGGAWASGNGEHYPHGQAAQGNRYCGN